MFDRRVKAFVGAVLAVLIGCLPVAKEPQAQRVMAGDLELTLTNKTKAPIETATISDDRYAHEQLIGGVEKPYPGYGTRTVETHGPAIPPGGSASFKFKPGNYTLSARSPKENSATGMDVLYSYRIELTGPLQLVVYDTEAPPTDVAPPAGAKQVAVLSHAEKSKRSSAEYDAKRKAENQRAQAAAEADYQRCKKGVQPSFDKPVPGRVKIDGSWTCIASGGATGTNIVKTIQLADGKITATIASGPDRNNVWEGVVKADELRFRYQNIDATGGVLKIDPGGRAMTGNGYVWYPNEGRCNTYNLTCTK